MGYDRGASAQARRHLLHYNDLEVHQLEDMLDLIRRFSTGIWESRFGLGVILGNYHTRTGTQTGSAYTHRRLKRGFIWWCQQRWILSTRPGEHSRRRIGHRECMGVANNLRVPQTVRSGPCYYLTRLKDVSRRLKM